jgi:hypothetical protein
MDQLDRIAHANPAHDKPIRGLAAALREDSDAG